VREEGNDQMSQDSNPVRLERLVKGYSLMWKKPTDRSAIAETVRGLEDHYDLDRKIAKEPEVKAILKQMFKRLARSYPELPDLQNKRILDIACGSNSSKLPVDTPFGMLAYQRSKDEYTALFEPWFCRILFELGAVPVGIDFGDLEREVFAHYRVDLGKTGALDFLPDHSFDGIQDSRLFGSPEFTTQFPDPEDRLEVAREIVRQERRLLKADGIMIHSDAIVLLG
jgi:hypothetical protein